MENKELLRFKYIDDDEAAKYVHCLFYSAGLSEFLVIQYIRSLLEFTPREFDGYNISFKLPIDPDLPDEFNNISYLLSIIKEKSGDTKLTVSVTDDGARLLAVLMDLLNNSPEEFFTTVMGELLEILSDYDKLAFVSRNSRSSIHSIDLEKFQVKFNNLDFSFVECEFDEIDSALVTEDRRHFDMSTNYPWVISILNGIDISRVRFTDMFLLRSFSNTLRFIYDDRLIKYYHPKWAIRKLLSPRICLQ
jgi:hypothetical protein